MFAMECLPLARLFLAQKKYPRAADLLKSLRKRCLKRELSELVLQIDILQSATLHAINQYEPATALLQKALAFAETQGYLRLFINDSKLIKPILRCMADRPLNTTTAVNIEKILVAVHAARRQTTIENTSHDYGHEGLTQREMEILGWVAQGFQNKEIGQKAFIATSTVKSHIKSIMNKLEVNTRIQIILKARETGIL